MTFGAHIVTDRARDRVILTDGKGRPIERPDPLLTGAAIEEKIAWLRARATYQDRIHDVANRAFVQGFKV